MLDLSIVICAHNAAGRIAPTLEAVVQQRCVGIAWEALVVANACSDDTAAVAEGFRKSAGVEIRIVEEPVPGLSSARHRGVAEARGRIISFVDDDNVIRSDWVNNAVRFMGEHPGAGVVGGRIRPRFVDPESEPADFDERFAGALACWDLGDEEKRYPSPVHYPPCGAGLTMYRETLDYIYRDCGIQLSGRTGGRLISGEDYELGLLAIRMGWEAWYTPELEMEHILPPHRLTDQYLENLRLANVESELWLDYLRGKMPRGRRDWYLRLAMRELAGSVLAKGTIGSRQRLRAASAWHLFRSYPFERVERAVRRAPSAGVGPSNKLLADAT